MEVLGQRLQCPGVGQGYRVWDPGTVVRVPVSGVVTLVEVLGQRLQRPSVGQGFSVGDPGTVWHMVQSQECYAGVHRCAV